MELAERAQAADSQRAQGPVERGLLMRVLAVAKQHQPLRLQAKHGRKPERVRGGGRHRQSGRSQPGGDGGVVLGRATECLERESTARVGRDLPAGAAKLLEERGVLGGIDQNHDSCMVLRGRADHRRATHVDLLDDVLERNPRLGGRRLERVEVHRHQVDRADPVAGEGLAVRGQVPTGQDPPVDRRVEGLHPAVEHLGEARHVGDLANGQIRRGERPRRSTGRQELHAQRGETAGQVHQPGLVGDGEERAANRAHGSVRIDTRRPTTSRRPSA